MYKDLKKEKQGERILNSEDSMKFWTDIWSTRKEYNQHTERLKGCRKQFENLNCVEKVEISQEMVIKAMQKDA